MHDSGEDTGEQAPRPRPAHSSHFDQARTALEELAQHRAAAGINRLPSEHHLAVETGFSRPTVRSALLALQKEGKIVRQHGVGTFINRHALGIKANLAEHQSFLSVIEQLGYEAHLDVVSLLEEKLPDDLAERADHMRGTQGVVIDRLFRASGEPAVLSRDHIPTHHLAVDVDAVSAERSIFAFIRRWTPHEIRYSVASIFATDAEGRVAELLSIDPGTAVLGMEHCHIDQRDEVIGITQAYVRNDVIRFSVVRSNPDL